MDAGERKALADIEQYGCHVIHVMAEQPLAHFIVNEYNTRVRAGERFAPGQRLSGFIEGFECEFRAVHPSRHRDYMGWDIWLYGGGPFDALQLIYPTTSGVWPWDAEADEWLRIWQPLLERAVDHGAR